MNKSCYWFFGCIFLGSLGCGLDEGTQRFIQAQSLDSRTAFAYAEELSKEASLAIESRQYGQANLLIERARSVVPSSLDFDRIAWKVSALDLIESKVVTQAMSTRVSAHRVESKVRGERPTPLMELAKTLTDLKFGRTKSVKTTLLSLTKVDSESLNGHKARVFLELGKLSIAANDMDDAISRFHETLAEDGAVWNARLQLSQLLSQKGEHKPAVEQAETMIEQKKDGITLFVFGRVLNAAGEFPRAITAFENSLEYDNVPRSVFTELGQIYFNQKNFKMAQQSFNRAYTLTQALADKFNEGIAFKGAKAYGASAAVFEQVIQLKPDNARAHAELIGALTMANRTTVVAQAVARFEALKAKYPSLKSIEKEIESMVKPKEIPPVESPTNDEPKGAPSLLPKAE